MSLNCERKIPLLTQMSAGIHLSIIKGMKSKLDAQKNRIIVNGEMAVIVTFLNGKNEQHQQLYWLGKGNAGKEKYFTKMCIDAGIDMSVTPMDIKKALNKRLWLAIREVYTLENDEVKKDITGKDYVEYFIFNTFPCFEPDKVPVVKGNPMINGGQAMDGFISYKNEGQCEYEVEESDKPTLKVEELTDDECNKLYNDSLIAGGLDTQERIDSLPKHTVNATLVVTPIFDDPKWTNEMSIQRPIEPLKPKPVKQADEFIAKAIEKKQQPNFGDDVTPDSNF